MPYKGQSILLLFYATEDSSLATSFYIDDVSVTATLKGDLPVITSQPVNATATVGQTATFTVTAVGTPTLTYQWLKNGTRIAKATSSSYTTPATTIQDNNAKFSVIVANSVGNVISDSATLTVNIRSRDLNNDGVVDILDLASLARAWGATSSSSNWNVLCDLDGLGATNGIGDSQLNLWLAGWLNLLQPLAGR